MRMKMCLGFGFQDSFCRFLLRALSETMDACCAWRCVLVLRSIATRNLFAGYCVRVFAASSCMQQVVADKLFVSLAT